MQNKRSTRNIIFNFHNIYPRRQLGTYGILLTPSTLRLAPDASVTMPKHASS